MQYWLLTLKSQAALSFKANLASKIISEALAMISTGKPNSREWPNLSQIFVFMDIHATFPNYDLKNT